MARLGPFEPNPVLAVAVSGGADSMALALLAQTWAATRGGSVLALTVDHGLRPESADEAALTMQRLVARSIPTRKLSITGLPHGTRLSERARIARYAALTEACRSMNILHLLLGHHALDQAETLAMRVLRNSDLPGLAGMAALRETATLRLLRPLLGLPPLMLRAYLRQHGVAWVEDPSNRDRRALRPRLRTTLDGTAIELTHAARVAGVCRARQEQVDADELAQRIEIRPEGFALLSPGRVRPGTMRALLRTIAGAAYAVSPQHISELAADPGPATLAGVRILPAGRLGSGWMIVREERAIHGPAPAVSGITWDGRFRILLRPPIPTGCQIGRLGDAAPRFRRQSSLPAAVLRTLPALWQNGRVLSVPHLDYAVSEAPVLHALFMPPAALASGVFVPGSAGELVSTASNDCNFRVVGEPC